MISQTTDRCLASLVLLAGIAAAPALAQQAAEPKPMTPEESEQRQSAPAPKADRKVVTSAADLPVHEYTIAGKASELLVSDKPFADFRALVQKNHDADLAAYDIQDPTTLRSYAQLRLALAMLDGHFKDVSEIVGEIRSHETKEASKLTTGLTALAYADAIRESAGKGPGDATFDAAFKRSLSERVSALPWATVSDDIKRLKGRAEIITRDLILGQVQAGLDPVVEQNNNKLSSDLANQMVGMRMNLDLLVPVQPLVASTLADIIRQREASVQRIDRWTPSVYTIAPDAKASPVVVAAWDSGVDTNVFPSVQLWTNSDETLNGKDDDNNGFVDDVHGIAYALDATPTPELLHAAVALSTPYDDALNWMKGWSDVSSNIDSEEASQIRAKIRAMPSGEVGTFMEDMGLLGNISHGTHVAGIMLAGNPFARLLTARLTFDYKEIPQIPPSEELSLRIAKQYADTIAYFKKAGVRVVNMSWGGSLKDVEAALEMTGTGGTQEERAALAKKLFDIMTNALESSMRSAPDILFVAAAGNSDNNNQFAKLVPSGLDVPNMITVGAIDETGKPTGFTTFGKNVSLYANGFEVESPVPGGRRLKFSGTSMAAPQVANLAGKLLALRPDLTTQQVIDLLRAGAVPMEGYEGRFVSHQKRTIEKAMGR